MTLLELRSERSVSAVFRSLRVVLAVVVPAASDVEGRAPDAGVPLNTPPKLNPSEASIADSDDSILLPLPPPPPLGVPGGTPAGAEKGPSVTASREDVSKEGKARSSE